MAGPMLDTTAADWAQILDVNLWGVIHGSREFGRRMRDRGEGGHIVNVASAAAFTPSRSMAAYATSKSAVLMLTECLRAELVDEGITVSAVCPGFVDTGIATATRYVGVSDEEQQRRRQAADRLYRKRRFTPDKVADAVLSAVDGDRAVVLVGTEARVARLVSRVSPRLGRRFARLELEP